MAGVSAIYSRIIAALTGVLVLLGLYLTSLYSYLLFHSLAEIFSIIVACGIFMLAWNSRQFLDNNYLLLLGIAFLFVAGLDLLHTLAYKGMNIFPGYSANLPTQLWIAARYLQSISLFIAPLFLHRNLKPHSALISYTIVFGLLVGSIFYWPIFPDCYLEGVGLTPFKIFSEYLISLILLGAIILLLGYRREFNPGIWRLLVAAIVCTIGAELAFTFYVGVYDLPNLIGHILKIMAFYLIYKAIIETGLVKPYSILFRHLKQSEERLRQYNADLQARNEELDAFAHTVAHDLKTPLSTIIVCNNLLRETKPNVFNEEQLELTQTVEETAFKMNDIIDDLLLLAEVRKAEVEVEPLDMARLITATRRRLARMIEECRGEIISPRTWPVVLGYGPWIEEVWANYISNALKYGGRPPRVELGASAQPGNMVRFWVQDNGAGLSAEEQKKLFHSLARLGQLRVGGYGFGLSIVKRIVEKLNGQVGVESEGVPGQGSCFFFTLPAEKGQGNAGF
ncbi:MAG: hypothetical protein JW953_10510 [Anaerolineae bacterium]|nr:hypothetical protein [Anaerolineae bacterium]